MTTSLGFKTELLGLSLLFASSCAAPLDDEPTRGSSAGSEADDVSSDESRSDSASAASLAAGCCYRLRSDLQITAGAVAPEPAYQLLDDLHSDPGGALVTIASEAGVPAADSLFAALPASLSSRIEGWLTDAISTGELAVLMQWSQSVLAHVEIESTLEITDLRDTSGRAQHRLDVVTLEADGERRIAVPQIEALPGAGHAELDLWIEDSGGILVFGEQRFGLLLGEAAYQAFDEALRDRYGAPLRDTLGAIVDCPAAAAEVADRCVLGACVGHEEELTLLCEEALDHAVDEIRSQFRSFDTEILALRSGEARVGGDGDLEDGLWQAEAELGVGLRELPAQFSGRRDAW